MSDPVTSMIAAAPDTPAGRQAAWWVASLHQQGEQAAVADIDRYVPELARRFRSASAAGLREAWRSNADRTGPLSSVAFTSRSDLAIDAELATTTDRRWKLSLEVEAAPPHRIARERWERINDFDLEVREATPADWPILADLERRCPITFEGGRYWFDRGDRWFDFARLMEDCTVGLAFVDGAPAAMTCGAEHTVRIGGEPKTIVTVSHLRVLPEHQRKSLWSAVNGVLEKYWPVVDGSNAFIAVENAGMQHGFRNTPDKWPTTILAFRFFTERVAGHPHGREATPQQAESLAARLNAFHGGEEMFVPYTAPSLAARLERASDLYGWGDLWVADRALVGVWPAGRARRLVTERNGSETFSEPGVVLDYAFEPGGEGDFEALIRAWCARLAEQGMNRLTILSSPGSPGVDLLQSLANEVEAFNHWTPGVPPPPDAAEKGLYIDPIYF